LRPEIATQEFGGKFLSKNQTNKPLTKWNQSIRIKTLGSQGEAFCAEGAVN
jgi:hypothetical protein